MAGAMIIDPYIADSHGLTTLTLHELMSPKYCDIEIIHCESLQLISIANQDAYNVF